jgi:hypothetical protein
MREIPLPLDKLIGLMIKKLLLCCHLPQALRIEVNPKANALYLCGNTYVRAMILKASISLLNPKEHTFGLLLHRWVLFEQIFPCQSSGESKLTYLLEYHKMIKVSSFCFIEYHQGFLPIDAMENLRESCELY